MKTTLSLAAVFAAIILNIAPCAAQQAVSPQTLYETGINYYEGKNVTRDYKLAHDNFMMAAKQGHADAWHMLGLMYEYGRGVKQDVATATACFREGAKGGNPISQFNYAVALLEGKGVTRMAAEARKWLEKSASQGYKPAQYNLGLIYYKGDGTARDVNKAYPLILEAATGEGGLPDAMYTLASMWLYGEGCQKDLPGALQLLEITASHNYWKALYTLGAGYYDGADFVGGKKDMELSFKYLGQFYLKHKDGRYSQEWQMAMGDALRKLQAFYRFGIGVKEDTELANKLLQLAGQYGDADSEQVLRVLGLKK